VLAVDSFHVYSSRVRAVHVVIAPAT
jgi:hypothetical protein